MKTPAVAILAVLGMIGARFGEAGSQEILFVEASILCPVIIHVPAESGSNPPLLVVLHGRGDTAANMAGMWNALTDPKPILAVLEAPYPMLLTGDKGARLGESWDSLNHAPKILEQAAPKTINYIVETIRAVRKKYATGGVYVLGHSQGVSYAYRVALQEPNLVKGVIAMAGYLDPERLPTESFSRASGMVNIFIGHGKKDPQIDPEVSRGAKTFLAERGFKVILEEFDGGHSMSVDVVRHAQAWMMALERINNGNH